MGNDPYKTKIKNDVAQIWELGKNCYKNAESISGRELYAYLCMQAKEFGWEFGSSIGGHLIGQFPHSAIHKREIPNYIHHNNLFNLKDYYKNGVKRYWILEVHIIDRSRQIGAFYEQLLNV